MFELCFDRSDQLFSGIFKRRLVPWERFKLFIKFQSLEAVFVKQHACGDLCGYKHGCSLERV